MCFCFWDSSVLFSHVNFVDDNVVSQNQQIHHFIYVFNYVDESILWVSKEQFHAGKEPYLLVTQVFLNRGIIIKSQGKLRLNFPGK